MRSFFCSCKSVIYTFLSAKLVLKRAIERRIVFKSHHIDDPPALGFSFTFTEGLGFDVKFIKLHSKFTSTNLFNN